MREMWSVDSYQIIKILITRCENFKIKILKIQIQSNCCLYWWKYRSVDSQGINKILATVIAVTVATCCNQIIEVCVNCI